MPNVCAIGKVDDGTLRVCCSIHQYVLCAHHYARTHSVETSGDYYAPPCNERQRPCREHHGAEISECSWCGSNPLGFDGSGGENHPSK